MPGSRHFNDPRLMIATSRKRFEADGHYSRLSGNNYARVQYSRHSRQTRKVAVSQWKNHLARAVHLHVPAKMLIGRRQWCKERHFAKPVFLFSSTNIFTYASTRYDATPLVKLYETMATRARKNAHEIPGL